MGLKENVIVGRLIPAGTGMAIQRAKRLASERDRKLELEEQKKAAEAAALAAPENAGESSSEGDPKAMTGS
jgi:DNA-directed RNA polymerase subunit beta'